MIPDLKQNENQSSEDESGGQGFFFFDEDLQKFVETAESWQSENKQTLGELWMAMLR